MGFLIEIVVFLVCILLSLALCFIKWMFVKKQNVYVDLRLQYKKVEKRSSKSRDQCRPRVEPCECPAPCERPVPCKRACSPVKTPARLKCPIPMILPSCSIDSSDSIVDCCIYNNHRSRDCICSLTAVDEKFNRSNHRSRETPEQNCHDNKKQSQPKLPSQHCKKQMSDYCTCSDSQSFKDTCTGSIRNTCSRFGSKIRFLSKDKKKHVECVVLVDSSTIPFNNQPPNKENIAIVPVSFLTSSKTDIKCPKLTKDSEDINDSPSDVLTTVSTLSLGETYERNKIMERMIPDQDESLNEEGKVFQPQNEVDKDDKTDLDSTQKVPPTCSSQNLELLKEKRKERKKTLMKFQSNSEKLDDIHKWMTEASNSEV